MNVPPTELPAHVTAGLASLSSISSSSISASVLTPRCVLSSSSAASGVSTKGVCTLSLPRVGRFLAVACSPTAAQAGGGTHRLCSAKVLGRTAAEWRRSPLVEYLQLAVSPTASQPLYSPGDSPVIELTNPTAKLCALCWYGAIATVAAISSRPRCSRPCRIQMPALETSAADSCRISLSLVASADLSRHPPSLLALVDFSAPMLARYTVTLDIAPPPEQIRVAMDVAKVCWRRGKAHRSPSGWRRPWPTSGRRGRALCRG